jgi:hypothetical protein
VRHHRSSAVTVAADRPWLVGTRRTCSIRQRRLHFDATIRRRADEAFQAADVDGIVALLTEDAWMTMPPLPLEYQGRELAGRFLAATALRPGWTGLLVLTLSGNQVCAMTRFDAGTLPRFGLPLKIPD